MKTTKTFPEVNGLKLSDAIAALNLGYANLSCLKPEFQGEAMERLVAIQQRILRLKATQKRISSIQKAR